MAPRKGNTRQRRPECVSAGHEFVDYRSASGMRCRTCLLEANRVRAARRRVVFDLVKTTAGCADCGYSKEPCALDFDHIPGRGEKAMTTAHLLTSAWPRIWAEIEKCEVVCANCHRVRTRDRWRELNAR